MLAESATSTNSSNFIRRVFILPPCFPRHYWCMNKVLYISAITALLTIACKSFNPPNHSPALALRYHDAASGLTFLLPATWQGYAVLLKHWEGQTYLPANDTTLTAAHGP